MYISGIVLVIAFIYGWNLHSKIESLTHEKEEMDDFIKKTTGHYFKDIPLDDTSDDDYLGP